MKLNEVFLPLQEEAYDDRPSSEMQQIVKRYHSQIIDAINAKNTIFRGMKFTSEIIVADGTTMDRRSKNTQNYYTLMLDNELAWADYPKRSKSFICASDDMISAGYGSRYVVIPLEGQEIGVCSDDDFWASFQDFRPSILNNCIWEIQRHFGKNISEKDFEQFKKDMREIGPLIDKADLNGEDNDIATFCHKLARLGYEEGMDFYDWYAGLFAPEENGFSITSDLNDIPERREVWMSGKVLFINHSLMWDKVKNYVLDMG